MKKVKILILLLIITLTSSCTQRADKRLIATSIVPIKYFTKQIAGDKWDVVSIIPSNANHSNYEPNPQDLRNVSDAKIYFTSGNIGFEDAWNQRFKEISNCTFLDISKGIEKIGGHYHGGEYHGADPHYWLAPREAAIIAKNIYYSLSNFDKENAEYYKANYEKLIATIHSIDKELSAMLKPITNTSFLIYHPALTYFAAQYNLNQIAIEDHGKEPSASHIAYLIDISKKEGITNIFYQTQYTGSSVENIAKEIGATTTCFDPMSYNWKDNLLFIANTLTSKN